MRCDQCEAARINGVFCHETGCSNARKTWVPEREAWVRFLECPDCGYDVEEGEICDCHPEPAYCEERRAPGTGTGRILRRMRGGHGMALKNHITRIYVRRYRDNGQVMAYCEWSDGSRTESTPHRCVLGHHYRSVAIRYTFGEHMHVLFQAGKRNGLRLERETW